jgi:hypothetical protein
MRKPSSRTTIAIVTAMATATAATDDAGGTTISN